MKLSLKMGGGGGSEPFSCCQKTHRRLHQRKVRHNRTLLFPLGPFRIKCSDLNASVTVVVMCGGGGTGQKGEIDCHNGVLSPLEDRKMTLVLESFQCSCSPRKRMNDRAG